MRGEPVHDRAVEADRAGLVDERAADAIDERRLAGAVRADQPDPLAGGNLERDAVERDEAAEPLAQVLDCEQRGHRTLPCASGSGPPGLGSKPRGRGTVSTDA